MPKRNPDNDKRLLADQYNRLTDAFTGFYDGREVQALNIAITLRVLVHETAAGKSLLSRLDGNYWSLSIQDKPLDPKAIFALPVALQIKGDGTKGMVRADFSSPNYQLVSLSKWWNDDYQPLGTKRLSKKAIILTVADKDGGAHIDDTVPDGHAALSEPPFLFGMDNGGQKLLMRPDFARGITAQAGCEMQDFLERHFLS